MATKLSRKSLPAGLDASGFTYAGRPASAQDDFGSDVGLADMACVDQFGESNKSKYYHAGVVQAGGSWFVYLEWGRISGGKSWNPNFRGQDFQFVQCANEADARAFFKKQCQSKNIKRLQEKSVNGRTIWVGKNGKDGYVVQRLATRERGLPDAYGIKDDKGVAKKTSKKVAKKAGKSTVSFQPQVVTLARDLVGGTQSYARAAAKATGIIPTMEAIQEVRDELIPEALKLIKKVGNDEQKQIGDRSLQDLSKYVATIVPRPIPRSGDASALILSTANILRVQQDLDTFEAALQNEDFDMDVTNDVDPDKLIGAKMVWLDPNSEHGRWVAETYLKMTNNRHGYVRGKIRVKNIFTVERPHLDTVFAQEAKKIAKKRAGDAGLVRARLQPRKRSDVADISDVYNDANVFLGVHGTRGVNVQPILSSNLRLPKSLKGVHVTGSAFGHGIYYATDILKSYGYTGHGQALYGGGGNLPTRGFFMFLCDVIGGKPYMTRSTMWDAVKAPRGCDTIAAYPEHTSVQNDEHVIFDPNHQRIRYLIEGAL